MDVCEYGATGKPIVDCQRYKQLQAEVERLKEKLKDEYHRGVKDGLNQAAKIIQET